MEVKEDVCIPITEKVQENTQDGYQRIDNPRKERNSDMPGLPDFMQDERARIQNLYERNKFKLDKWVELDNTFKQLQRIVIAFTMIGAAIMGVVAGVQMNPILSYIAAGLAAFGALKEPLAKLFIKEFTTKKRVKYMNKCKVIKECLDAMFLSYIQASDDGNISVDEIKKYQTLIQSMEVKLFDIEADMMAV